YEDVPAPAEPRVNVAVEHDPYGPPEVISLPESLAPHVGRAHDQGRQTVITDPNLTAVYKQTLPALKAVLGPLAIDFADDAPPHYRREATNQLRIGVAKVRTAAALKL